MEGKWKRIEINGRKAKFERGNPQRGWLKTSVGPMQRSGKNVKCHSFSLKDSDKFFITRAMVGKLTNTKGLDRQRL
jgi:hypothetical protein